MNLSIQVIEQCFSHELVEAGRQLCERGDIESSEVQRGGELLTAVVRQDGARPLRVYIQISQESHGPVIHGECSCEVGEQCVHVVGALIHALGDNRNRTDIVPSDKSATVSHDSVAIKSQTRQCLLYIVHLSEDRLSVDTCVARRLSQADHPQGDQSLGNYEGVSRFKPSRARGATPPRFLDSLDQELLQILDRSSLDPTTRLPGLAGEESASLFERLVNTQRCYFESIEASVSLRRGDPQGADLHWQTDPFGRQRMVWRSSLPSALLLPLSTPWYLDRDTACCAPLTSDLPDALLWELLRLHPLAPEHVAEWWTSFQARHATSMIPAPKVYEQHTSPSLDLQPCLRLSGASDVNSESFNRQYFAALTFDYVGFRFAPSAPDTCLRDGRLIRIVRDKMGEQQAIAQLLELGLEIGDVDEIDGTRFLPVPAFAQTSEQAWIDFQLHGFPRLREQGWRIEFDGFPLRLVESSPWTCRVDRLESADWFALSLDVELEGRRIELLPLLLELLTTLPQERQEIERHIGPDLLLPLEDREGKPCLLRLSGERALHLLELLLEVCGGSPQAANRRIEINRAQLARLALLDADATATHPPLHWCDDEGRQLAERLKSLDPIPPCVPPSSLQASLRPYQQEGLAWLQFLREFRLAGILADDMGLGKTLQTLAHLLLEKERGRTDRPSLVVVPTSLTFNWLHEAKRFTPELRVLLLHGAQRKKSFGQLKHHDLIITTYPLLIRDRAVLAAQNYHLLILDEAQTVKNPKSQASRLIRGFKARHRLCLTGTPLENHLGELWSLFDFLMPGLLGDAKVFRRDFRTPIESRNDKAVATRLSHRLRPFLLRRTKQQVAKELPDKSEIIQSVVLEGAQRELYETVRLSMHRRVREEIERQGLARSHIVVLDALMKLRQVCCDPRLLKGLDRDPSPESAKLTYLMSLLEEMVEEGRRILLFSQFTTMLALIEAELRQVGLDYLKLTGQTRDRERVVKRFQRGEVPLFLISLKAGGVGLNLTAADTVIHYDPWWNPAVERQATDRSHRIGQQQKVFVYKLICEGTLEEKILAMQQRKQRLADGLYQADSSQEPQWNDEDIEALFGPLQDEETTVL
jgi:superfamily II DNA or RNA helicase